MDEGGWHALFSRLHKEYSAGMSRRARSSRTRVSKRATGRTEACRVFLLSSPAEHVAGGGML